MRRIARFTSYRNFASGLPAISRSSPRACLSRRLPSCLAAFRRDEMSYSTSNGYFRAMRTFCRWLVRSKRARENPIAGVTCMKVTDADRKRRRRPLNDADVAALVQAARESADAFMGLPGPDRAILYIVAVNTGLRASELASLTPESFELDGAQPLVRCLGGYTKNGVEAVLPLRSDVAAMLRTWLADKPAGEPVWPGKWASQRHGAEMMRIDLSNANVDYQDARKRVADFHALRHTFIFPLRQGFAGRANLARRSSFAGGLGGQAWRTYRPFRGTPALL
jgi:integrase